MTHDHLPYRPGVGILLLNAAREVFVGQRIDQISEAWQMPQGGIDDGETALEAAQRELKEETGVVKAELLKESSDWLTYDLPEELIPKIWGGRFRGQRQKWFAMRFTGSDSDINLNTPEPEFKAWKWVTVDQLSFLIVPFKRDLYQKVVDEFRGII